MPNGVQHLGCPVVLYLWSAVDVKKGERTSNVHYTSSLLKSGQISVGLRRQRGWLSERPPHV